MSVAKRIVPCLDVDKGRVVKGVKFVDIKDAGDPVEAARGYDAQGADELVILDITASSENRGTLLDIVEAVATQVFIPLTVGGGVRKKADIRALLNAGADKVAINSAAVSNPDFVKAAAERFGSQCIVVAIDARRKQKKKKLLSRQADDPSEPPQWEVFTHGGRKGTGIDAIEWARKVVALGAGEILLTSMDRDGTKEGFDLELTRAVSEAVPVPVIASGGVGTLEHLFEGLSDEADGGHADAVLAASIFHFGEHTVVDAKQYLSGLGVNIRPAA